MSEPMSSGEIEDVLSSIRRLVSEDLRQSSRPAFPVSQPVEPPAPAVAEAPGKLLLTPALRVVPAVVEPAEPGAVADTAAENTAPWDVPAEDAAEEQAAEALNDVTSRPALVLHRNDKPGESDDQTQAWAGEPEGDTPPVAPIDRHISQIGAGMTVPPQGWESETGDPPVNRLSWVDVADSHDDSDGLGAMRFVHRAPAPQPDAVPPPPQQSPLIGTTSDEVLDEALLREIVREVLRDELQGNLGERMTRNIRKLVRAEVHRALTLRDWD